MNDSQPLPIDYDAFRIEQIPANPEPFRLVNRVPIHECGEPLVDLRESNTNILLSEKCLPYVRARVSGMLQTAVSLLPAGYRLKASSALRTLDGQAGMYWANYKRMQEEHPEWPVSTLRRYCNKRWAPPDTKAPPGHCTGGAVDVALVLEDGTELDFRSPYDERWSAARTAVKGLSEEATKNRRLLSYIMHSAGFSNCRDEYWHWSYGDSAWAVRMHAPAAIYGLITPPENATDASGEPVKPPEQNS